MLSLCREAAFAVQDDWEKTCLLERRGKALHLIVPDLAPVCPFTVAKQDGQGS
jgi:hypothetical protein